MGKPTNRSAKRRSVNTPSIDDFTPTPRVKKPDFKPLNDGQKALVNLVRAGEDVIVLGPAGTGKTYCIANLAGEFFEKDRGNKIVITRPNEPAGRSLGHFPGTLIEKMAPWTAEFFSVLVDRLGSGVIECGLKGDMSHPPRIEIVPLETMRGRSFRNSFVILDEAQNTTPEQAYMFWTRPGEGSVALVNGDLAQSDIKGTNGLETSVVWSQKYGSPATVVQLTEIVRRTKTQAWIDAVSEWKNDRKENIVTR